MESEIYAGQSEELGSRVVDPTFEGPQKNLSGKRSSQKTCQNRSAERGENETRLRAGFES